MKSAGGLCIGLLAVCLAQPVSASAWTQRKGQGQVIVKYESMRADEGFDPAGIRLPLGAARTDSALGLFAEYGLSDQLTVQLKADYQDGRDAFVDYEGQGPIEIGLTWQVWRDDATAVSLYAGYAEAGEGRNAGYAAPGVGQRDYEMRGALGRSFTAPAGRGGPDRMFVEIQGARRMRQGLPDETRVDLTVGSHFGGDWMLLGQAFGGVADDDGPRWLSVETSVVRRFGDWSLQAGWRSTVSGRETPIAQGPVLAIWRRF